MYKETATAASIEDTQALTEGTSCESGGPTTADRDEPSSPVIATTTPRKQFSMDFPPDVMQLVAESDGVPKRWTNIKGILDRGRR